MSVSQDDNRQVEVHSTAIVEDGAKVGNGTRIWHQAHVRSGAVIGAGCVISKNVFVDSGAIVGNDCSIQNNVSVYNGVELGDRVFVGPSAVFTNDRSPRPKNEEWVITPTHVADGVSVGANATIICGNSLGRYCMVGAGSVVTRSVKANELVFGNPAAHRGWVCDCGEVISRDDEAPDELRCAKHREEN